MSRKPPALLLCVAALLTGLALPAGSEALPFGPSLSAQGPSPVTEGNGGTTPMTFTIRASSANPIAAMTVHYATSDGTASAGSDYDATAGTATIPPGSTSTQVVVSVRGDRVHEQVADETLMLTLSSPDNAVLGSPASATGVIRDDDPAPVASISDSSVTEGDIGTTRLVFAVRLSGPTASTSSFTATTTDGTAQAGSDYTSASSVVTFAPGQTMQTVAVAISGDTTFEADETLSVALAHQAGDDATDDPAAATATATILNDDPAPTGGGGGGGGGGGAGPPASGADAAPPIAPTLADPVLKPPAPAPIAAPVASAATARIDGPARGGSVRSRRAQVTVPSTTVTCPAGRAPCAVTVALLARGRSVGGGAFSVASGSTRAIHVVLFPRGDALLRRYRSLALTARILLRRPDGSNAEHRVVFTVRRA